MLEKNFVESDSSGHFRLLNEARREKKKWWVSPEVKKILEESGKEFEGVIDVEKDPDPKNE